MERISLQQTQKNIPDQAPVPGEPLREVYDRSPIKVENGMVCAQDYKRMNVHNPQIPNFPVGGYPRGPG